MNFWHVIGLKGLSRKLRYGWTVIFIISTILFVRLLPTRWVMLVIFPLALSITALTFSWLRKVLQ